MLLLSRIRRLTHISSVSCRTSPFLYRNFSKTNSRFELKMNHVSTQEALKLRTQDSLNLLHVDVRNISELEQDGFIPKTVSVPLPTLSAYHLPVDKQQPILFSCRAGGRSAKAAQQAVDWGHERVYTMDGGFDQWKAEGLTVAMGFQPKPFVKFLYDPPTGTCQFIVSDEESKEAVIVDPVLDYDPIACSITYKNADQLLKWVFDRGYTIRFILETHAHADHLSASQYIKEQLMAAGQQETPQVAIGTGITQVQDTFAKLFSLTDLHTDGRDFDHLWKDGEQFKLGRFACKALHVPGHTPDHMCYLIGDAVLAGDTIFMPDSGSARCDFPGGSAHQLYASINKVLFSLPPQTRIFVGHDYQPGGRAVLSETTVLEQMEKNKHCNTNVTEEEFIKMRTERDKTLGNPKLLFQSLQVNIRAGKYPSERSKLFSDRFIMRFPVSLADKTPVASLKAAAKDGSIAKGASCGSAGCG